MTARIVHTPRTGWRTRNSPNNPRSPKHPASRRFDRRLIAPMILGSVLNPINSSMIAVALVPIGAALGAPPSRTAWLVSGLYLATAVGQPVIGRLVDMYGPRRLYLVGTGLVGLAGLFGALSPTLGVLIAARVLLGIGTSAAYPAAMRLTRDEAKRTGEESPTGVLTALAVANQTVSVIGPALGGLLIGVGGWRTIFTVNVPLSVACLVLGALHLPKGRPGGRTGGGVAGGEVADSEAAGDGSAVDTAGSGAPGNNASADDGQGIDAPGMALFTVTLVSLMLFLMAPRLDHWYLPLLSVAFGAGFAVRELRVPGPFVDLRLLGGNIPLMVTFVRQFLAFTTMYGFMYGYTQWLEEGRGLSASAAGLVLLPLSVTALVVSTVTGRREAIRVKLFVGSLLQAAACLLLLTAGSHSALWVLFGLGVVMGLPQGLVGLANQSALYRQAPPEHMGSAAGLLRTFMYLGALASSAAGAWFYPHGATTTGLHGLALFLLVCTGLLFLATVLDRSVRPSVRGDSSVDPAGAASPSVSVPHPRSGKA